MSSLNKVILIGNLTRDPELRTTPKGTPVGEIALALNETYKSQDGKSQERTTYVDVVLWGRQAEVANDYLKKGRQVMVEGKLQLDQWESKEGEKRSRIRVRGDNLQFLGSKA
jgi:single-strand DNA-binding protein